MGQDRALLSQRRPDHGRGRRARREPDARETAARAGRKLQGDDQHPGRTPLRPDVGGAIRGLGLWHTAADPRGPAAPQLVRRAAPAGTDPSLTTYVEAGL